MLYRLSVSTVRRSSGRSACAAAAYRSGERVDDERQGLRFYYRRRRERIRRTALIGWEGTREELWNAAERCERRRDSITARECLLTLFAELDEQTNFEVACTFGQWLNSRYDGVAVDVSLHAADVGPHAHLLFTTRSVSKAGAFGLRTCLDERKGRGPAEILAMREAWCSIANAALLRAQLPPVSHRAKSSRRLDPEYLKLGAVSTQPTDGPEGIDVWSYTIPQSTLRN